MSTAISLEFETRILNTLNICLGKISDSLERKFDPTDKQSMSLFRQFCMAIRIRIQWTKSIFVRTIQPASKNKNNEKKFTNVSTKEQPVSWDYIDETLNNYPKSNHPRPSDQPINGLLMKP